MQYLREGVAVPSRFALDSPPIADGQEFPVVVYFHGALGFATMQPTLMETLASYGMIGVASTNFSSARKLLDIMAERNQAPDDFFFDKVDENNAAAVGYSAGGPPAISAEHDERIKAILPISTIATFSRSDKPMLLLTGTSDYLQHDNERAFCRRDSGYRYLVTIKNAGHLSFVENDLMNFYASAFFGLHLLGQTEFEPLLAAAYAEEHGFPAEFEAVGPDDLVGDANRDGRFDAEDLHQVLAAGKFGGRRPATWKDGDWNADCRFDRYDLIAALQMGHFLGQSTFAAESPLWTAADPTEIAGHDLASLRLIQDQDSGDYLKGPYRDSGAFERGSGRVALPEPPSFLLSCLAIAGFFCFARWRRRW
jgi:hypothetical protein